VQDDQFDATDSVTVARCTSDPTEIPLFRVLITPRPDNGVVDATHIMADKVSTMSRGKIGRKVGALAADNVGRLDRAVTVFLGLG
jgi:mRNA interferase MazF